MYIAFIEDNFITGYGIDTTKDGAINVELTIEQYNNILTYGNNYYIYNGEELILNPNYQKDLAEQREILFKEKFFKVGQFGYYRRVPKGYTSAIESINTAFNMCAKLGGLPANTLIFYPEPDYRIPEQCTEEWLIANQIKLPAMNETQFAELYIAFVTAWNKEEH